MMRFVPLDILSISPMRGAGSVAAQPHGAEFALLFADIDADATGTTISTGAAPSVLGAEGDSVDRVGDDENTYQRVDDDEPKAEVGNSDGPAGPLPQPDIAVDQLPRAVAVGADVQMARDLGADRATGVPRLPQPSIGDDASGGDSLRFPMTVPPALSMMAEGGEDHGAPARVGDFSNVIPVAAVPKPASAEPQPTHPQLADGATREVVGHIGSTAGRDVAINIVERPVEAIENRSTPDVAASDRASAVREPLDRMLQPAVRQANSSSVLDRQNAFPVAAVLDVVSHPSNHAAGPPEAERLVEPAAEVESRVERGARFESVTPPMGPGKQNLRPDESRARIAVSQPHRGDFERTNFARPPATPGPADMIAVSRTEAAATGAAMTSEAEVPGAEPASSREPADPDRPPISPQDVEAAAFSADRADLTDPALKMTASQRSHAAITVVHAPPGAAVRDQIAHAMREMKDGSVELILAPEELGSVRFVISQTERGPHLAVTVDRPETLDMIRRHADDLLRDLRDQGLSGAGLSFHHSNNGQGRGPGAETAQNTGSTEPPIAAAPAPVAPRQGRPITPGAGIDIRI
ncbi:flagellar hook-length control protein FliK [Paracoccus pacificus]|uniref:Flagellar hook-length control protein FliK n=1 Tax=Paracoccus pacificus TaxID=1463598 RepID=A0ABW4R6W7_9RHOB